MNRPLASACALMLCLLIDSATAGDYAEAYARAQRTHRPLIVAVAVEWPRSLDYPGQVLCELPDGHAIASHASLRDMGGAGVFVVDFSHARHFGRIVSLLPRQHCTTEKLRAILDLPAATLTQRTLIWAVRMHPERPQSTDGQPAPDLMTHAAAHSQAQADASRMYHNLPTSIATSEIVAVTWAHNKDLVAAAIDLVASWRGSPPHWRQVRSSHQAYGYDMRFNGRNWYGTGVFR